ncbi:chemotaxis protein CheV [Desulfovibrio oxamicus]|uniref:Chemotaxis protein CheV n=1 Tax=Nitratidesulfovibrio oxamicus TaxID=32016 RepID=A0ABS0IZW9_9BACT|nr:chemotaxis protein [Nitratidesulfovibrio oxamicus]MBG3875723.1 chemotaxis protein CheV [Nitratidesulfovibrio oxamicus]
MSQTNILLESGTNELEIIEFYIEETLSGGRVYRGYYGMNVAKVLEIIRRPTVTGVPSKHHPAALGTFNLRGRVLPLVDLGGWLGKQVVASDSLKVIVSEFSGMVTAFLVSGVTRIHRLSWSQVEAPDSHMQTYSGQSVIGVVRFEDRIVFLLDMEKIVASMNPRLDMGSAADAVVPEAAVSESWHVLIADDSSAIRNMIGSTLEKAGFRVTRTSSGREAWDVLSDWRKRAEEERKHIYDYVDLVVSDIEMPEMDGHNLTRRIKEDQVLQKLPVVLFSSLITDALRHKGAAVGADDQISKPDLPGLTNRVRGLIERFRQDASAA